MFKGFRDFIVRGNVVDLAVGVVIGGAFTTVVKALVADILTPLIAAIVKQPDFGALSFTVNSSQFLYGDFVNATIAFIISAAVVYYLVVLPINKILDRFKGPPPAVTTKTCDFCKMTDVAKDATRCPHCTSELAASSDSKEIV